MNGRCAVRTVVGSRFSELDPAASGLTSRCEGGEDAFLYVRDALASLAFITSR